MTEITLDTIRENRIKAVAALRNADESLRLVGDPYDPETGKMCACAVISKGLGLPLPLKALSVRSAAVEFDYVALLAALDISHAAHIWHLNDIREVVDDDAPYDTPVALMYTFAEIGGILARQWGLE